MFEDSPVLSLLLLSHSRLPFIVHLDKGVCVCVCVCAGLVTGVSESRPKSMCIFTSQNA